MRREYYLFKRKSSPYYQVRIDGKDYSVLKLQEKLDGIFLQIKPTSKAAAGRIVDEYLKRFGLAGKQVAIEYLESFWTENSEYIRQIWARGKTISEDYLSDNHAAVKRFCAFLSQFRISNIADITPQILNRFILQLKESGLSGRRCNGILQAIAVPLNTYYKGRGEPERSPARLVNKFPEERKARKLWTPDEVRELFADPGHWINERVMAANLLAAVTGMRRGEICGLLIGDIGQDYINVCHNWQGKLVEPKWGSKRMVPVPVRVVDLLTTIHKQNPWKTDFVFWGARRDQPLSGREILRGLKLAMEQVGIDDKSRNLSFHAWRHWYNSMLRGNLPEHELRALTGHSSEKMTDRYTQVQLTEDMRKAVANLASFL